MQAWPGKGVREEDLGRDSGQGTAVFFNGLVMPKCAFGYFVFTKAPT